MPDLEWSIIIPVLNEQDNVAPLVSELEASLPRAGSDVAWEVIIVDDGSTDQTLSQLKQLAASRPWLVVLHREQPRGQSAAMAAGIAAARGAYIGMLDGDLQNDPADLPRLFEIVRRGEADLAQGDRTEARNEGARRKLATAVGRLFRQTLLGDPIRDTGCTLRVMRAGIARQLPLHLRGMHRYVPVYARMLGARIVEVPVNHRPRTSGRAKYGMWDRAAVGLYDVLSVRWMLRRHRDPAAEWITPLGPETAACNSGEHGDRSAPESRPAPGPGTARASHPRLPPAVQHDGQAR